MNESFYYYGLYLIFPVLLLLAAGLGWKKLAGGLTLAFVMATVGAAIISAVVAGILAQFDHGGGEWRGLKTLAAGILGFIGGFIVCLAGSLIGLAMKKRLTFERTMRSPGFLRAAGVGATLMLFCIINIIIGYTPSAAFTGRLVRQVEDSNDTLESRAEIVKRGQEAVPIIITALHRHPYALVDDRSAGGSTRVAPLLELLGQIGGADAVAEMRRWADAESWPAARAAAMCGLAAQNDPGAAKRIGEFLSKIEFASFGSDTKLFRALAKLKAVDQVGAIQTRMTRLLDALPHYALQDLSRQWVQNQTRDRMMSDHTSLQSGLIALGEIGTDEAWAALAKFHINPEGKRRALITIMLERCPGEHVIPLLAKALDDSDPLVRESAYVALWHREPKLQAGLNEKWDSVNEPRMREALRHSAR